jgi:hypothetical protein
MIHRPSTYDLPKTIDEAANLLISDLSTQQMTMMERISDRDFDVLCDILLPYIQDDFRIWSGNDALLMSCFEGNHSTSTDPMRIIMERVRKMLQKKSDMILVV